MPKRTPRSATVTESILKVISERDPVHSRESILSMMQDTIRAKEAADKSYREVCALYETLRRKVELPSVKDLYAAIRIEG